MSAVLRSPTLAMQRGILGAVLLIILIVLLLTGRF